MSHVQWDELSPGGTRLEEIRFELGYLDRKDFAEFLSIHPSDYCRILRDERLTLPRLVGIFTKIIEFGHYQCFEAVLVDLDRFDGANFYLDNFPLEHWPSVKQGIITTLKEVYDRYHLAD